MTCETTDVAGTLLAGPPPTTWAAGLAILLLALLAITTSARRSRQRQPGPPPLRPTPGHPPKITLPDARPASPERSGEILDAIDSAEQLLSQIRSWLEEGDPPGQGPDAEAMPNTLDTPAVDQGVTQSANDIFLERVRSVVARRLHDEDFNVTELAHEVGVDRSHLYRRLQTLIDESPSELIRTCRLEHAAQLLRHRTGTVSEIAQQVGFKSVAHFSHSFRERYQMPPSAYGRESDR